jgi:integrase
VATAARPQGVLRPGDSLSDLLPGMGQVNPAASYLWDLSESGRRSMRARLERAVRYLRPGATVATFAWETLRFEHVKYIKARLLADKASASTVNLTLAALRQTARIACDAGLISPADLHAILRVPGVRHEALPPGRMLSRREIARLFKMCARDSGARGRRDAALLALLYGAGLRRDEAGALPSEAFDPQAGALRLRGKGGRTAALPLPLGAARALRDWIAVRGRSAGPLLAPVTQTGKIERGRGLSGQAVYLVVKRMARAARVMPFTPHDLRRTYISEMLSLTDGSTAQKLGRHASFTTTRRYDRRDERQMASAVRLLPVPYSPPGD